jgi:LysR family transcriptional regulator (chromosome initiation inhibitor)
MLDYPAARAVALVAQTGSFEAAARALAVTPSAISQRVKQLEERLGAVLIDRGTPCRATAKGEWLCRHMDHVGMLEQELIQQLPGLQASPERATIAIATNADSLGTWFLQAVSPFTSNAGYLLNIAVDDEDHTAEWLAHGRVLAAVTSVKKPIPGCQVIALGALRYRATASAGFVARHFSGGVNLQSLAQAPGLTFNQKDQLQHAWIRRAFGQSIVYPTHWLPSTHSFVDACVLGMGWGLNPEALVRDHLAAGRLVELVPGAAFDVPLFWQVSRLARERLAALTNSIVATAKHALVA